MKYTRQSLGIKCSTCPVKRTCLARDLEPNEANWLDQTIQYAKIFEPGEYLFKANSPVSNALAIHSGSCKEYALDSIGIEYVNKFSWPGDVLGLEYIDKGIHAFNVIATEKTTVCLLPIELLTQPKYFFTQRIFHILCDKLRDLQKYPQTTNAKKRVAIFFLELIKRHTKKYLVVNIPLHISQVDISHHIGIANETLSRILSEFAQQGIVVIKKHCICALNMMLLQELIGSS